MTEKKLPYKVIAEVISVADNQQIGPCPCYKVGDELIFERRTIRGTICYSALNSMMYKVTAMRYGVDFPWLKERGMSMDVCEHQCPDPARPVVFRIRRVR